MALIVAGLLAPFIGFALQLGFGGHFLLAGLVGFGISSVAADVWRWLRPELTERRKHKLHAAFSICAWIVLISLSLFYVSSIA